MMLAEDGIRVAHAKCSGSHLLIGVGNVYRFGKYGKGVVLDGEITGSFARSKNVKARS